MEKILQHINEEATPQQVEDSIKKRYRVEINYLDSSSLKKGEGRRIIEPVTYGLSKAGNPVIRAFQPFGDTKTKVPHWKMFRLDKIESWKPFKNNHFKEPPQGQWNAVGKYNPNGDKSMSTVYLSADFTGSQKYERGEGSFYGLKKHNDELHAAKLNKDPFAAFKQNIKNSVMATPEVMARIEQTNREKEKNKLKKQEQNSREMASITDFGNENQETSLGPLTKKTNNTYINNNKQLNYNNVVKNGPQYKQTNDEDETEENQNN